MIQIANGSSASIGLATVVLLAMTLGGLAMPAAAEDGIDTESREITVAENGSIERVDMGWGVDNQTYTEYEMIAETEGYDRVDVWFESLYEEEDWVGNVSTTTSQLDDGYVFSIELVDVDPDGVDQINVTVDGDTVVYEEFDLTNPDEDPDVSESTTRVIMPGEISDSNAHEVRDNVAVWHLHEEDTSELFVEATVEDSPGEDADGNDTDEEPDASTEEVSDTDDSDENGDGDGVPGFGGAVALVALSIATALTVGRRADR